MGALEPQGRGPRRKRRLLVISGGMEAVPGLARLRRLGLHLVVSDGNPEAPGFQLADDRILASTYDVAATVRQAVEYHREKPLAGVLSIAADVPRTVAAVAAELSLPGPSLETARLAADKLAMKERLLEEGVPVPWFSPVEDPNHLEHLLETRSGELVIKPVDSRGARGVLRLRRGVDPTWAFEVALAQSSARRVLVEAFLPGDQLSTESVILGGRPHTLGFSDRNYEHLERYAPFIIENGGCQPSRHLERWLPACDRVVARAARAIGLRNGTLKGDLVLHPERGPVVIEVAPRLSGGWYCTDQIPLTTGVDLVAVAGRLALGEALDPDELEPHFERAVAVRYLFPPPGRVDAVAGLEALNAESDIHLAKVFVTPGEHLPPVTDHTKRAGVVLAIGNTREAATERAERAVAQLEVRLHRHAS